MRAPRRHAIESARSTDAEPDQVLVVECKGADCDFGRREGWDPADGMVCPECWRPLWWHRVTADPCPVCDLTLCSHCRCNDGKRVHVDMGRYECSACGGDC